MKNKLIVESAVKHLVHSKGGKTSKEALVELEKELGRIIEKAVNRANANGRRTVAPKDV